RREEGLQALRLACREMAIDRGPESRADSRGVLRLGLTREPIDDRGAERLLLGEDVPGPEDTAGRVREVEVSRRQKARVARARSPACMEDGAALGLRPGPLPALAGVPAFRIDMRRAVVAYPTDCPDDLRAGAAELRGGDGGGRCARAVQLRRERRGGFPVESED